MQTQLQTTPLEFPIVVMGCSTVPEIQNACALSAFFLNCAIQKAGGMALGLPVARSPAGPSFRDFIETRYLPFVRTRKRSFATDERLLRQHVYPTFASIPIDAMTTEAIEAWKVAFKGRGYAPASVNRVLAVVKYVLTCAVRWKFLNANPAKEVEDFRVIPTRERHLSIQEARRLVKILRACPEDREAKAIELLLLTGARKSEILTARWENVNFSERILAVPLSKSGETRFIPLSKHALAILKTLKAETDTPWVFPQRERDKPIRSVWHVWRNVRDEAGLTDVRLHDLRHSFASFLINSGQTLYEVQKILGHGSPTVTMRYAHLDNRELIKAVDRVGLSILH